MTLLVVLFFVTMLLSAGTYLLVNRTLEERDTAKVRDRLVGKAFPAKKATSSTPLFLPDHLSGKNLLAKLLAHVNLDKQMQALLEQSGVPWAPGQVVLSCLVLGLVGFNAAWYLAPAGHRLAFLAGPLAAATPIFVLRWKRKKRIYAFESQFPDSLQFIARAMRAGHAFSVSLEMLHSEFPPPLGVEFRRTFEEQNLGLPIDIALEKLATRVPLMDVQFFVAAVLLQKRTGGNLAEILDKLSSLIRERFKLRGEIRTISAQGRMSSVVLTAIPTVVAIMMYMVHREHMMFFVEEDIGQWMAGLSLGFQVLGYFIMRQIVKIEV